MRNRKEKGISKRFHAFNYMKRLSVDIQIQLNSNFAAVERKIK